MAAGRRHSTVFDVLDDIADGIRAAEWPSHGDTLERPDVGHAFDEDSPDVPAERVTVVYRIDEDALIQWVRQSPAGRDERFLVDIEIDTNVHGQDKAETWSRLRELAEVVQGVFYDPTTGVFTPPGTGEHWSVALGGVIRVVPELWHGPQGWLGHCVVTVAVQTRI